jgi:uncharacterized UPF0160 family protein
MFGHRLPVLYAISPMSSGNWMVDAMPPEPGSFAQRLPLPEAWAGLRDAELAAASGAEDAIFANTCRFVDAATSSLGMNFNAAAARHSSVIYRARAN